LDSFLITTETDQPWSSAKFGAAHVAPPVDAPPLVAWPPELPPALPAALPPESLRPPLLPPVEAPLPPALPFASLFDWPPQAKTESEASASAAKAR
jgi:hypothetical protein